MMFGLGRRFLVDAVRTMSGKTVWIHVRGENKPAHLGSGLSELMAKPGAAGRR